MTLLQCGKNKIGHNRENSVPSGSSSHSLVLVRLGGLIIKEIKNKGSAFFPVLNQKKMLVEIQHIMEVLNLIYMVPYMTALTKMAILNIYFALHSET